jgi:hypothetical protein
MIYIGDFLSQATIYLYFTTHKADGTPITLAGSPVISIYKDNVTTETTTGPTLTVDFDGRTGLHCVAIATTDAFYTTGHDYKVVITTGTVDSVSVIGYMVGSFSIENRFVNPASKTGFALAADQAVNVTKIIGTALSETSAGYLAAGFKKLFDVETPIFTLASFNQGADSNTILTDLHNTDLPALKVVADAIKAKTDPLPAVWCSP